ncbi:MAG: substrate-binding domain-containing protein [Acidobacteriota bacterium]|nr:substrate-binding domain-containing protein [Acidobacteriota bacterium]
MAALLAGLLCSFLLVAKPRALGQGFPSAAPQRPDGQRTPVDPGIPGYDPVPPLKGDLYVGGGFAPTLLEQWAAIFQRAHPNVRLHVAGWGSTAAFGELIEGVSTVTLVTREFMPFERDFLKDHMGMDQIGIPVASGGYSSVLHECVPSEVVLVNQDNPVKGITMPQLDAILSKTRRAGNKEDITRWGQLGVSGEWADKPIHVYLPKMPDGVPNFLKLYVMQDGEFKDTVLSLYDHPGATSADRYALVVGNRGPGASLDRAHPAEMRDPKAKSVPLAYTEAGPFATGTFDEVRTRAYPLSRYIYLYLRATPNIAPDPLAREFVRVALSQEGQREVARTCLMPLPEKDVQSSMEKVR